MSQKKLQVHWTEIIMFLKVSHWEEVNDERRKKKNVTPDYFWYYQRININIKNERSFLLLTFPVCR